MRGVAAQPEHLVISFDPQEPELLAGVVEQVVELVDEELGGSPTRADAPAAVPGAEPADPFQAWEQEFSLDAPGVESLEDLHGDLGTDPVVARLFPDAYRDDPAASHDFRRFTQAQQRDAKLAQARTVLADLAATDRRGRCLVVREHVGDWLKALTAVRLALAVRLEITDEISADEAAQLPEEDPRSWLHEVYQWIGWLQECILEVL